MVTTVELSSDDIKVICQRYLNKEDDHLLQHEKDHAPSYQTNVEFTVLKYELKPTSEAPVGFFGRHQFLFVDIQRKEEHNQHDENESKKPNVFAGIERLCFFTKSAPSDIASRMEYLEEFGVFKKEILVYRDVLPNLLRTFPSVIPKCFYADNNLLVFENLVEQGFKMSAERDGILNYEHLKSALKGLAALHASSIVFEQRQRKKIPEFYAEAVVENCYPLDIVDTHVRMQNFNNANRVFCEILKALPKYKDQLSHILKEFPSQMRKIFDLAQPSDRYRNVFSHGDLWANNFMFRYDGECVDVPIDCRLVDFQLSRYAPPILDVLTILTIPTSREFRESYMLELLHNYYSFMSEFLTREGLNIEDFLPKQQFFNSVAEFRIGGLIESLLFSHLTLLPSDLASTLTSSADGFSDFFDRKRVEFCMSAFNNDRIYRERLTDMLEDFVDNFILA